VQPGASRYTANVIPATYYYYYSYSYARKSFPFEIALAARFDSLSWFVLLLPNAYVCWLSPNEVFMSIKPTMSWRCLVLMMLGTVAFCRDWGQFVNLASGWPICRPTFLVAKLRYFDITVFKSTFVTILLVFSVLCSCPPPPPPPPTPIVCRIFYSTWKDYISYSEIHLQHFIRSPYVK